METRFYATKTDISTIISAVEACVELQYIKLDHYPTMDFTIYESGLDFPNLGYADHKLGFACSKYIVLEKGIKPIPHTIKYDDDYKNGMTVYTVEPNLNPNSVLFTPAGIWQESIILEGNVGTAYKNDFSVSVMKLFTKFCRKKFTNVHNRFVGPEAMNSYFNGMRLTPNADSPPACNLVIPIDKE